MAPVSGRSILNSHPHHLNSGPSRCSPDCVDSGPVTIDGTGDDEKRPGEFCPSAQFTIIYRDGLLVDVQQTMRG